MVKSPFSMSTLLQPGDNTLQADARAALRWSQRQEDHPLQSARGIANTPAIRQALERVDDEHLAVDDAVPVRHRLGAELELAPDHRLEVVVHHPLREERALCKRSPQLLRRVRKYALDHKATGTLY